MKKFKIVFLVILVILSFVLTILPTFATSIAATIILYDIDWNEVATFHTIVDDTDEVPGWVQYNGDAYSFEYGSGNTYGYIADGGDFTGYWYENTYIGNIEDLPFPPGYQPPEPDPNLIKIRIEAYFVSSSNQSITLYSTNIYGEPGDPYTYIPLYQQGYVPQYNSYSGYFGSVDSELYILYVQQVAPGTDKQITLRFLVYDNGVYRTMYTSTINIDRSYEDFDTRSVFSNSMYLNASPYIDINYDSTDSTYDIYLVNINDSNHYMQTILTNKIAYVNSIAESRGHDIGYEEGMNETNPNNLANFIPKIFGSVISSGFYIMNNLKIGDFSLAYIIGLVVLGVVIYIFVKLVKK